MDHEWDKKVWEESWEMRNMQDLMKKSLGEDCSEIIEGALSKKSSQKRSSDEDKLQGKSKKEGSWMMRKELVGDRKS